MDDSITIHQRILQRLATEMYKVKNKISPLPIQESFTGQVNVHDIRYKTCWEIPQVRTFGYGNETIRYRGLKYGDSYQLKLKKRNH